MKIATITAVYNEEDLLPQYLKHYEGQGVDAIFLLDNGSTDKTAEIAAKSLLVDLSSFKNPKIGFDGPKHHAIMKKMVGCIGHFDYVILVDVDEFIVSGDKRTIKETIAVTPPGYDLYTTEGYVMVQGPKEAEYDPSVPLTAQRKQGFFDRLYSKPAIVNPAAYPVFSMGIHSVSGIPREKSAPGLFRLLHYAAPSEAIFLKRRLQREPRVHIPKAMKNEDYFKKIYWEWRANPELAAVL